MNCSYGANPALLSLDYKIFTCVRMGLSMRLKSLPDNVRDSQAIRGNSQRRIDAAARGEKRGIGDIEIFDAAHFILRR